MEKMNEKMYNLIRQAIKSQSLTNAVIYLQTCIEVHSIAKFELRWVDNGVEIIVNDIGVFSYENNSKTVRYGIPLYI